MNTVFPPTSEIMKMSAGEILALFTKHMSVYKSLVDATSSGAAATTYDRLTALLPDNALNTFPALQINLPPSTRFQAFNGNINFQIAIAHDSKINHITLYSFSDCEFDPAYTLFYYVRLHFLTLTYLLTH